MRVARFVNCNLSASARHLEVVFDGLFKGDIPLSNIIWGSYPKEAFGFSLDPCSNVVRCANGKADELGVKGIANEGAYCLYKALDQLETDRVAAAKMTSDQWKQHVLNDHIPFSRECATCLQGGGKGRHHRKVPRPDALTLSVDICGPFRPGEDRWKKSRYFMVGVFTIPVRKIDGKVKPLPLSLEEALKAPEVEEEEMDPGERLPAGSCGR